MLSRSGLLVEALHSSSPSIMVIIGLTAALIALWRLQGQRPTLEATDSAPTNGESTSSDSRLHLAITVLLVVTVLQLPFRLFLELSDLPAVRYAGPLDRLFSSVLLVTLATALLDEIRSRRGKIALAAGLSAALLAWAAWAPIWQEALVASPLATQDPTGIARGWDGLLALAATALALTMAAQRPRLQRWCVGAPALLALGSLYDAFAPSPVAGALGARSAQLTLAVALVIFTVRAARAAGSSADVAGSRLRRLVAGRSGSLRARQRRTARTSRQPAPSRAPVPAPLSAAPSLPPPPAQQLGTVAVVHDALTEMGSLGASAAVVMLRRGEDLETWVQIPPGEASRLGRLTRSRFKTVVRAMDQGGLTVGKRGDVRDLDSLYDQLGAPHAGAVRVEPIGRPARGAILAGRAYGEWTPEALESLGRLAAGLDQRLAALERHGLDGNALNRMLGALEAQSASLDWITRRFDHLSERVKQIESRRPPMRDTSEGAPTSAASKRTDRTDDRAGRAFADRADAFEQALSRAPWGVAVTDAEGRVAFANEAALRQLGVEDAVGRDFAALTPDPAALTAVLNDLRSADSTQDADTDEPNGRTKLRCTAGKLRFEIEPLDAPGLDTVGALIIVTPVAEDRSASGAARYSNAPSKRDERAGTEDGKRRRPSITDPAAALVPGLVDALREPMMALMAHRDVLLRRTAFADVELSRHIGVVDAYLGRLDVRLTDLLTALELATGHFQLESTPLDAQELLNDTLTRSRSQLDEKGLRIERHIDDGLPAVRGDRRALSHVLDNLLATAIDRSAHGAAIVVGARLHGGPARPPTTPAAAASPPIMVFTIQYRDWWHDDIEDRIFAIGDGEKAAPALRIARILTEVQGGRAWGEQVGNDGKLGLNVGLPT